MHEGLDQRVELVLAPGLSIRHEAMLIAAAWGQPILIRSYARISATAGSCRRKLGREWTQFESQRTIERKIQLFAAKYLQALDLQTQWALGETTIEAKRSRVVSSHPAVAPAALNPCPSRRVTQRG